jgi:hypothetical protein
MALKMDYKICISGAMRSGKDLTYKIINMILQGLSNDEIYEKLEARVYPTWAMRHDTIKNIKFAKPVYEILSTLTNKSVEYISEHKNDVCVFGITYRIAMQKIASDLFRDCFSEDTFVVAASERGEFDGDGIITDCRFPNESDYAKKKGFKILKLINERDVHRDSYESDVKFVNADHIIYTQGKLTKCLISEVRDFLNKYYE